jgi:hypothetical protein
MTREHKAIQRKLLHVWKRIKQHDPQNDIQNIAMLQCEAAWDLIHSMRILAEKKHGAAVMILCRSLFERSAATDVLINAGDAQIIRDYIDYGKTIVYEVGEAMKAPQEWLELQKTQYDAIKRRLGRKKWYGSTKIEDLVNKSQHGQVLLPGEAGLYRTFYKEASAISHGDSYLFLSHRDPKTGWQMQFDANEMEQWGIQGLSTGYQIFRCDALYRSGPLWSWPR